MKLNYTRTCIAALSLCMLSIQPVTVSAATSTHSTTELPDILALFRRSKSKPSRNNHAVRIYPDPVRRAIHVVAKENKGQEIDFFVFDLQGTMIEHVKMDSGDHEKFTDLDRGTYIYRVFAGDEETATGNFEVR